MQNTMKDKYIIMKILVSNLKFMQINNRTYVLVLTPRSTYVCMYVKIMWLLEIVFVNGCVCVCLLQGHSNKWKQLNMF